METRVAVIINLIVFISAFISGIFGFNVIDNTIPFLISLVLYSAGLHYIGWLYCRNHRLKELEKIIIANKDRWLKDYEGDE